LGKYIESDSEKGGGELRFIGTRIPVRFALEYVADGKTFEWISNNFDKRFPSEAVAEAVSLATLQIEREFTGRKHRARPTRKIEAI